MLPVYLSLPETRIGPALAATTPALLPGVSPGTCITNSAQHPALPVARDRSLPQHHAKTPVSR